MAERIVAFRLSSSVTSIWSLEMPDGQFTAFEAPRSGTVPYAGTNVYAVNLEGTITGFTPDDHFDAHAFVRARNGKATTFDIPGQIEGAGNDYGSARWAIIAEGSSLDDGVT